MAKKVLVIGGGPAGMMAAGTAAREGNRVILVDKNNTLGKKLLLTGKGRCNLTNNRPITSFFSEIPINDRFLYSAFYSFDNSALIRFFSERGLSTRVERGCRVFPVSNSSNDVRKVLVKDLKQMKVTCIKGNVREIIVTDKTVRGVNLAGGKKIRADRVIIATGGLSYPETGSTGAGFKLAAKVGHRLSKTRPALVPLVTAEKWVKETNYLTLKNVGCYLIKNDRVIYEEQGELSFTDYGVGGPLILTASFQVINPEQNNYRIKIDLKPALSREKLDKRILKDFNKCSNKHFANSLVDLLPVKLIPVFINRAPIPSRKRVNQITVSQRQKLVFLLKNLTLKIKKLEPIAGAIITAGGVKVSEINPRTMESRLIKGLFFAGEVIDVAGYTGGYNLQIAFSTGYLAGISVS